MEREIFVAMFEDVAAAEAARADLERAGVARRDIALGARHAPDRHGSEIWDWLYAREPAYRRHVEDGCALLAVEGEGDDYDPIASILLRHDLRTRNEMVPDKTSQSARVRRYARDGATARSPVNS